MLVQAGNFLVAPEEIADVVAGDAGQSVLPALADVRLAPAGQEHYLLVSGASAQNR